MKQKTNSYTVLLTASDYARKYGLSRTAVNNMIKESRIKAINIGGIWLVSDIIRLRVYNSLNKQ